MVNRTVIHFPNDGIWGLITCLNDFNCYFENFPFSLLLFIFTVYTLSTIASCIMQILGIHESAILWDTRSCDEAFSGPTDMGLMCLFPRFDYDNIISYFENLHFVVDKVFFLTFRWLELRWFFCSSYRVMQKCSTLLSGFLLDYILKNCCSLFFSIRC